MSELRELQRRFDLYKEAKEKDIKWLESKLQAVKDSLMSDEEIWKRYSAEKDGQWELNLKFKRGIQTQRERTKKAIG